MGWLRTRPSTTWSVSRTRVTNPAARAASQIRISAWWAERRRHDLVRGVDGDEPDERGEDHESPAGQANRRARPGCGRRPRHARARRPVRRCRAQGPRRGVRRMTATCDSPGGETPDAPLRQIVPRRFQGGAPDLRPVANRRIVPPGSCSPAGGEPDRPGADGRFGPVAGGLRAGMLRSPASVRRPCLPVEEPSPVTREPQPPITRRERRTLERRDRPIRDRARASTRRPAEPARLAVAVRPRQRRRPRRGRRDHRPEPEAGPDEHRRRAVHAPDHLHGGHRRRREPRAGRRTGRHGGLLRLPVPDLRPPRPRGVRDPQVGARRCRDPADRVSGHRDRRRLRASRTSPSISRRGRCVPPGRTATGSSTTSSSGTRAARTRATTTRRSSPRSPAAPAWT